MIIQTYPSGNVKGNWAVTQVKIAEIPKEFIEGVCKTTPCTCTYFNNLKYMPGIFWCNKYQKRINDSWPFPNKLPECNITKEMFIKNKCSFIYDEI